MNLEANVLASRVGIAALALSAGVLLSSATAPSHAQDDLRARGDRACKGDANRLCQHSFSGGDMAILQCFQQNRTKLSRPCRQFLIEIGQLY